MDEKESKTKPRYKQIAEQMEQRISIGEFPPGHFLPSERLLAKELHVNRSTIVAAYDELQAAGVVERKRGSGTIVSRDIWCTASFASGRAMSVATWRRCSNRRTILLLFPALVSFFRLTDLPTSCR
ncbi:hypothetical protein BRIN106911_07300 [Brevibacillus invocatus]